MIAAILLAAGSSRRFGSDKLAAMIDNRMVIERAAQALSQSRCTMRFAILSAATHAHGDMLRALGYTIIVNDDAASGMASSIRAGVDAARRRNCRGVLIALADMPFVPAAHFDRVIDAGSAAADGVAFSAAAGMRTPPAFFLARWFDELLALDGEDGARRLLRRAPESAGVLATPDMLRDIDTPGDLAGD